MVIKVLAIGDVGNILQTIRKFTKKSEIYIINFYKDGAGVYTYADDIETFPNYKVSDHVKRINEIKNNFDICITMGIGERIAYLADLNYVVFYVGRDIDTPHFIKNSKERFYNEPLRKLNFLERWFYKNAFKNAIVHLANTWVYEYLKKYTENGIKLDLVPVDPSIFNPDVKPIERGKKQFTFFSPQRMGKPKGTDLIWKALPFCKSDFEIIQVEWFEVATKEELMIKEELLRTKPRQVTLIPMIKRKDMPRYYKFADAILGNMRMGTHALIELEAVTCKKPVIMYTDPEIKIDVNGKNIKSPFLPTANDPKTIAETIDNVVMSDNFRNKLLEGEYKFVQEISNVEKVAEWWDTFFEQMVKKHNTITKNTSKIRLKFRLWFFLIVNRLYFNKFKKLFLSKL